MARRRPLLASLLLLSGFRTAGGNEIHGVSFMNFRSKTLELRWDDGTPDGVPMGKIAPMDSTGIGRTFEGHRFNVVELQQGSSELIPVASFAMKQSQQVYVVEPLEGDRQNPAYVNFLEEQKKASSMASVTADLDALHASGKLKGVTFQSRIKPARVRPAFGVVMKNFRRYVCSIYWDDGSRDGVFNGEISSMGRTSSMTTYPGDAFKLMRTMPDGRTEMVARFVMNLTQRNYVLEPEDSDESAKSHPSYLQHYREAQLEEEYLARTGTAWLGAHPPDPPTLPLYAAGSKLGEVVHTVNVRGLDGPRHLVALSWNPVGPRAFLVESILTPEECNHVKNLAKDKLGVSRIGSSSGSGGKSYESKTRTSKIAFIERSTTKELETMHQKFADVLNVSDSTLRSSAEHLQVVRYEQGQEYAPHFDYTRDRNLDRLATLLVYLGNDGGTSFPRAFDERGLVIKPKQGDAILFYSQLPDGNLDELSLHGGMPVASGTKWVCNLWMHSHGDRQWNGARKQEL